MIGYTITIIATLQKNITEYSAVVHNLPPKPSLVYRITVSPKELLNKFLAYYIMPPVRLMQLKIAPLSGDEFPEVYSAK